MKTLVIVFSLLLAFLASGAQSVTLAWNANTETNLMGYRLYYGTGTRTYSTNVSILAPTTTCTVTGLHSGLTYYFAVTAYCTDGLESDYSDEVYYTVPVSSVPVSILTVVAEQSQSASGPWTRSGAFVITITNLASEGFFYRARLEITNTFVPFNFIRSTNFTPRFPAMPAGVRRL